MTHPNDLYLAARDDPEGSIERMLAFVRSRELPTGVRVCALGFIAEHTERDRAIDAARSALMQEPRPLRREAIRILGKLRAVEALPALLGACRHAEGETALAMIRALEQIGIPEAEAPLLELLEQPEIRVSERAARALASLGTEVALDPLAERASTAPTSMALRQTIRAARHAIVTREVRPRQHQGGLSIASARQRGALTRADDRGALEIVACDLD